MNGVQPGSLTFERRTPFEGVATFVTESQLWVAAAVTSLSAYAARELDVARPAPALLSVFFSTLFIYNLDTSLDLAHGPRSARGDRARWFSVASLVCLLATLTNGPLLQALVVVCGGAICSLYAVPLGPKKIRLKDVPGTKSLFVGLSVACAVVWVPLAHDGRMSFDGRTLWLFTLVATLTTLNATLFDVRDVQQDRRSGLASLPVLLGATRTRALLAAFAAFGFGAVFHWAPGLRPEAVCCWALGTAFCLVLSPRSPPGVYAWLVDGALFVPWLMPWLVG